MRQPMQPIYVRTASTPVPARTTATLPAAMSARLRNEPARKPKLAVRSVNLAPIAFSAIAVLGGLTIAGYFVAQQFAPEPYVLPPNVSTVHPGDMRWFQQMNGKFHQWTVDENGTYHYVGPVKVLSDPSLAGMRSNGFGADFSQARRDALRNTRTEQ